MCNLHQIEYLLEKILYCKISAIGMSRLRATSKDLIDAGSCLMENLADFVIVFSLLFKWVKKSGMWIFFMADERLVSFWTKQFVVNSVYFSLR